MGLLISAGIFGVGVWLFVRALRTLQRWSAIQRNSEAVEAMVLEVKTNGIKVNRESRYAVHYRYHDQLGVEHIGQSHSLTQHRLTAGVSSTSPKSSTTANGPRTACWRAPDRCGGHRGRSARWTAMRVSRAAAPPGSRCARPKGAAGLTESFSKRRAGSRWPPPFEHHAGGAVTALARPSREASRSRERGSRCSPSPTGCRRCHAHAPAACSGRPCVGVPTRRTRTACCRCRSRGGGCRRSRDRQSPCCRCRHRPGWCLPTRSTGRRCCPWRSR